ncbi:MAG: polysulfide reductase NrfD [Planctomycetota bacterium]|jgi:Ni/Fe-hydrogenase subunit HybB-like protein|nr:polysulfide reductase NrfD [Planctomycetota bacterium]
MRPTLAELENPKTLIHESVTAKDVTFEVLRPIFAKPHPMWWVGLILAVVSFSCMGIAVVVQMLEGIGILGINNPVFWGTYITNFVFWIGIGHAGTLISAILFLFRQKWRTSINRSAEAMTIFAVCCAGLFPLLHTGRPWLDFWLFPYPNMRGPLWPQFRSPLMWDVFAISTYATTSLLFWYLGLIPDFATIRDKAKTKLAKGFYGMLSMGWTGTAKDWNHYERAYAQFAWIATPLVLSVHSTVSFDFAVSKVPGWHTTIFPPYFVAGAIFGGFGMVVLLLVPTRKMLRLEKLITINHLEICNKFILATGMIVSYAYAMEFFAAWFSESKFERHQFLYRLGGDHAWVFWTMTLSNCVAPLFFWSKRIRRSLLGMWMVCIFVNIGMWFERFNIFVLSLEQDHLPASWDMFVGTSWDWMVVFGSFGLFFILFLLFCKFGPAIAIAEVKSVLAYPAGKPEGTGHGSGSGHTAAVSHDDAASDDSKPEGQQNV